MVVTGRLDSILIEENSYKEILKDLTVDGAKTVLRHHSTSCQSKLQLTQADKIYLRN